MVMMCVIIKEGDDHGRTRGLHSFIDIVVIIVIIDMETAMIDRRHCYFEILNFLMNSSKE